MTIYDDYAAYTAEYKIKYGHMALILIEVGSFWELYDCNEHRGADMRAIGDLLNIQVSRKNKNVVDISTGNPEMAGFPSHALAKFMPVLLEAGYTVVLVGQVTAPPNPKRAVTQVLSQGTCLDYVKSVESNIVCALHIETCGGHGASYICGAAFVDVTTGACWIQENGGNDGDAKLALDHVYAWIKSFKPCEVVITGRLDRQQQDTVMCHLDLQTMRVFNYINVWDTQLEKPSFQNAFLKRSYTPALTGMLSPIEFCNLERSPSAAIAFIQALVYVCGHNSKLAEMLQPPIMLEQTGFMNVSFNASQQLEIEHLVKYLNRAATPMGRRNFNQRMTMPSTDPTVLNDSYDSIDFLCKFRLGELSNLHSVMRKIHDVERLFRRCQLHQLNPCEWVNAIRSLEAFIEASLMVLVEGSHDHKIAIARSRDHKYNLGAVAAQRMVDTLKDTLDMNVCEKTNMDSITANLFRRGRMPDADDLQDRMNLIRTGLEGVNNALGIFKLDHNDRDGYHLVCTSKRFKQFQTEGNAGNKSMQTQTQTQMHVYDEHYITFNKDMPHTTLPTGAIKINCPALSVATQELLQLAKDMHSRMLAEYKAFLDAFSIDHGIDVRAFCKSVMAMDWDVTNARNAIEYGYVRPALVDADADADSSGFFDAKGLRHPTVERLDGATQYVANDVSLNSSCVGMLLYGLNAAGKSTLMKAVGLSVIMAQCGMYVPCSSLHMTPFTQIFTRIHRGDNLIKGQSTFMVEVSELRNIMQRATSRSLVIGDELCSGTESASAIGIVAAGIQSLCARRTSFIFATHLHDLTQLEAIKTLGDVGGCLKVCHLHVYYDNTLATLVYDRKLRLGQGASIYGIEVCKALDMGSDFLEAAHSFRKEYLNERVVPVTSPYNASVYVDMCAMCKVCKAEETHHIVERHKADDDGMLHHVEKKKGVRVNNAHNLVGLCGKCHDRLHGGEGLEIKGFIQTGAGVMLQSASRDVGVGVDIDVDGADSSTPATPASTEDLSKIAYEYKKDGMSMVQILSKLKSAHGCTWTAYKLRKVITNSL